MKHWGRWDKIGGSSSVDAKETSMESWRKTWREGYAPLISAEGLRCLLDGLRNDDPRLIQGATTTPPPLMAVQDWPVEGADAIGYCVWQGDGLETVGETEEFFARMCFEVDQRLGEPAACRYWLCWYDETPRDEMRRQLIPEVARELMLRSLRQETREVLI